MSKSSLESRIFYLINIMSSKEIHLRTKLEAVLNVFGSEESLSGREVLSVEVYDWKLREGSEGRQFEFCFSVLDGVTVQNAVVVVNLHEKDSLSDINCFSSMLKEWVIFVLEGIQTPSIITKKLNDRIRQ